MAKAKAEAQKAPHTAADQGTETASPGQEQAGAPDIAKLKEKLVLTGADIVAIGEEAELLVGGKNYNTAIISQVQGIRAPQFRAISSIAFHRLLDETKVNATLVRQLVDS